MKTLEQSIVWTGDGFGMSDAITLNQVKRSGNVCIYERIKKNGVHDGHEVFVVKVVEEGSPMPGGTFVTETYESYPRTNSFGKTAWHIRPLKAAEVKFQELLDKQNGVELTEEALTIPIVEFTTNDLAEENDVVYAEAQAFIKASLETNTIKFVREGRKDGQTRGKPSKFFIKS